MNSQQRQAFARRVLAKRTELYPKMSLEKFSNIVGITRTTLRAAEDPGNKQHPSEKTIDALARAFRMTPEELKDEQRIEPDNKLLKDITEEDLRVAQAYHHAGLTVKQRALGVLQERQLPHDSKRELAPAVADVAKRFLALRPEQRYAASALIEMMESTPIAGVNVDDATLDLAQRLQGLPDRERNRMIRALVQHEQSTKKKDRTTKKS